VKFLFSAYLLVGGIVGEKPILKIVFTAGLPYDPAVVTAMVLIAGSFADPTLEIVFTVGFSP